MTKKRPAEPPRYRIWLKPSVHQARRRLPGNVRHRIQRFLDDLASEPRPAGSRELRLPDTTHEIMEDWEVRRAQLDDWRVVYAINESWNELGVLRVAKRPPYRYEDLADLLADLAEAE
ncbi:MAG TPA: plasmid stabilization system [Thermoanaerobaculia bacterium]